MSGHVQTPSVINCEDVQNYALWRILKLRSFVFLHFILSEIVCSVSQFHITLCIELGNNKLKNYLLRRKSSPIKRSTVQCRFSFFVPLFYLKHSLSRLTYLRVNGLPQVRHVLALLRVTYADCSSSLTPWSRVLNSYQVFSWSKNSSQFMESKDGILCSQQPTARP